MMDIYCCGCEKTVDARLTSGKEIYPHRRDLYGLPFWVCDTCNNFVGCHHKTKQRTRPLGCIPTQEIKAYRKFIHTILDPLWRGGFFSRTELYKLIGDSVGIKHYHTANISSVEEAEKVIAAVKQLAFKRKELNIL